MKHKEAREDQGFWNRVWRQEGRAEKVTGILEKEERLHGQQGTLWVREYPCANIYCALIDHRRKWTPFNG